MTTATPFQDDPAERKSRHLDQSQEIQRLGMTLVRQTAAKAEQALQQPDPDPEDKPVRTPDHVLQFVRLARLVNHSMAFETRIANDDLLRRPAAFRAGAPRPQPRPDGRRPLLRQALDRATKSIPSPAAAARSTTTSKPSSPPTPTKPATPPKSSRSSPKPPISTPTSNTSATNSSTTNPTSPRPRSTPPTNPAAARTYKTPPAPAKLGA